MNERILPEASDTERVGAALAESLPGLGSGPLVVYLEGELGSGKTTLVRGLLRALGVEGVVRSPTYTLVEYYESAARRILHADLYRLGDAAELGALGFRDELVPGTLLLVEWPDRASQGLPPPDLHLTLTVLNGGRSAQLHGFSQAGRTWLAAATARLNSELKRI